MIVVAQTATQITVTGHAGYADPGHDIVCEAVGALTQTLIASIEELTRDWPKYILENGKFGIETQGLSDGSKLLVRSFLIGIKMLSEAYPDNVKLEGE